MADQRCFTSSYRKRACWAEAGFKAVPAFSLTACRGCYRTMIAKTQTRGLDLKGYLLRSN
jgi:hypothetical protein